MQSLFPELFSPPSARTTGLLPSQSIEELIRAGAITADAPIEDTQVQPASIDLRLGSTAYRVRASFLPNERSTVQKKLSEMEEAGEAFRLDLSLPTILEKGHVYIVQLQVHLNLPSDIYGKANPKSTTGRLDIFTRLIADFGNQFEKVPPGYRGPLYVEIIPRTFSVIVRPSSKLNQLRLLRGAPQFSDRGLNALNDEANLVYAHDGNPANALIAKGSLLVSVDLDGASSGGVVGYRAKMEPSVLDFDKKNHYPCLDHWDPILPSRRGQLLLVPDYFYILASKERIRIPLTHAAEMVPYDPAFGEFRVHYAGFFDPGFGYGHNDILGTRAVLELRSYGVRC